MILRNMVKYMMKYKIIDTSMNEFRLPRYCYQDSSYYDELQKILHAYSDYVKTIKGLHKDTIVEVDENIKLILDSIIDYYNANFSKAKEKITLILRKYKNSKFLVTSVNECYAFRGMAYYSELLLSMYKDYAIYDNMRNIPLNFFKARDADYPMEIKDMLHIPLNRRGIVSTQRFSMNGIPCIYLATTSYCCWLEMNMPSRQNFYVSSFEIPNDLKVLNLCISQGLINGHSLNDNEEQLDLLNQMIKIWPLICATSFSISEKNRAFKSEYIVSQLTMQCASELKIDAIAYLSKKMDDSLSYPHAVNLAIPVKRNGCRDYWENAANIRISSPKLYSEYLNENNNFGTKRRSYVNSIYFAIDENDIDSYSSMIDFLDTRTLYCKTKFCYFDDYLVSLDHYPFPLT